MCKTQTLYEQIIAPHNKTFSIPEIWNTVQKYPSILNIEHLVELTMAETGGYEFINAEHCDFSDGSECKTASISPNPVKQGNNSYRLEISNVVSPGGKMKTGDLRVVVYNPHRNECLFYFIPHEDIWQCGINFHPTTGIGRIFCTWNRLTNRISKLNKFEVGSFEELARIPADTTLGSAYWDKYFE
jgi:hypothetical protein